MSELAERLLIVFIDVILPLIIGYYFNKYNIVSIKTCNLLLKLNIRLIITVVGFGSFWLINIDSNLFLLAFIGIVPCSIIPGILAYFYAQKNIKNLPTRSSYILSSMLSNTGTLGGLCAFIAMGQLAYAYVQVVAMAQNIFTLMYNFPLAEYFHQKCIAGNKAKFKPNWRSIIFSWNQIGLISMFIGAIFNLYHIPRPDLFDPIFNSFVHLSAWCGILPVGYLLNFKAAKVYKYITFSLFPVRFLLIPLICYFITNLFTNDPIILSVVTLMGLCPIGVNSIVITQLYQLNVRLAEAAFINSTAMFLFIIYPLFLVFIL